MSVRRPRVLSERQLQWMLTLYPPLFLQGVRCLSVGPEFRTCRMRVARFFLTRNLQGTTFGGSIFAAADPVYALLFWQILAREGMRVQAWLKGASIEYLKPAASALTLDFAVPDEDLDAARRALAADGRFRHRYTTRAIDRQRDVCAIVDTEIYLRKPRPPQQDVSGF